MDNRMMALMLAKLNSLQSGGAGSGGGIISTVLIPETSDPYSLVAENNNRYLIIPADEFPEGLNITFPTVAAGEMGIFSVTLMALPSYPMEYDVQVMMSPDCFSGCNFGLYELVFEGWNVEGTVLWVGTSTLLLDLSEG